MDTRLNLDLRTSGNMLFAEDFDFCPTRIAPEPELIEPTFSIAELEAARADAFRAGADEAAAKAAAADHALIRQAVAAMAAQFDVARDELLLHAEQAAAAIARLLLASLGTVLPELTARYGEAELLAIARILVPCLFKEPAVTLRLNPQHSAAVARQIEQCDPELVSHLHIMPTEAIPPGDMRVGWHGGGAIRDVAALWTQVTETLGLADLAPPAADTRELEHAG